MWCVTINCRGVVGVWHIRFAKIKTSRISSKRIWTHFCEISHQWKFPTMRYEGTGKELRWLHDTLQQHLRVLKAMGQEPSGSFITSLLELKLDSNMTFKWRSSAKILTACHTTQSYWNSSTFDLKPPKPVCLRLGNIIDGFGKCGVYPYKQVAIFWFQKEGFPLVEKHQ